MSKKIGRRKKKSYIFTSRRSVIIKRAVFIAAIVLLIPIGYFSAKYVREGYLFKPSTTANSKAEESQGLTEEEPEKTETVPVVTEEEKQKKGYKAFYVPLSTLIDKEKAEGLLDSAKEAGFNAVVFDVKDSEGTLLYASQVDMIKNAKSVFSENPIKVDDLKNVITIIKNKKFTAIPRMYTFKDHKAPDDLPEAKITLDSNSATTWLDNSPTKGGKAWLNPYSPNAHKYIIELAKELSTIGAEAIILDGIQFPFQTSRAGYGNDEMVNMSQTEVLRKFVSDLKKSLPDGTNLITSFSGKNIAEGNTTHYGGDPASFGGDFIAPTLFFSEYGNFKVGEKSVENPKSNLKEATDAMISYIGLRIDVMEEPRPLIMPWIESSGKSQEDFKMQIGEIEKLRKELSFIVYNDKGEYDFTKIKAN